MYDIILGISVLKSVNPYFRKHILGELEPHEFLFANSITIFILVSLYFGYLCCYRKEVALKSFDNYRSLSIFQIIGIIVLASLTISSTILLMEFDKNYNTPLINSLFLKASSVLTMLFVGIMFFEETYSMTQIFGFILVILGIFMIINGNLD